MAIQDVLRERLRKSLEDNETFKLPLIYVRSENPLVRGLTKQNDMYHTKIKEHQDVVPTWDEWESRRSRSEYATANSVFAKLRPIESLSPRKIEKGMESSSVGKSKSKRPCTSRYRGVHKTVSTKRWEAQFRKNGKPTSLGCFDSEESAARAYDKMILWNELHGKAGTKPSVMNFDPEQYKKIVPWLHCISQDGLLLALRREGREEAARRTNAVKKDDVSL